MIRALVTGAGGFIGHNLVKYLKNKRYYVRGIDYKHPEFEETRADEFLLLDLRDKESACDSFSGPPFDEVYHLAANMGGIGFIETHKAEIVHDNVLINMNILEAAKNHHACNFLYSSSACVYPGYLQNNAKEFKPLKESNAYPADAEDGYGWEKLYTERACRHYREDYGLPAHIVRFHNVYGPLGAFEGGREKSPAAICRKVILAKNEIEIWGDGNQLRSYCYVDDCVEGIYRLMQSKFYEPLNLGTDRMVSINELVDIVCKIAGKNLIKKYDLTKPVGVAARNSDNTLLKEVLNWEPRISLEDGLERTYEWIRLKLSLTGIDRLK